MLSRKRKDDNSEIIVTKICGHPGPFWMSEMSPGDFRQFPRILEMMNIPPAFSPRTLVSPKGAANGGVGIGILG